MKVKVFGVLAEQRPDVEGLLERSDDSGIVLAARNARGAPGWRASFCTCAGVGPLR
jgi:hypothetical protein